MSKMSELDIDIKSMLERGSHPATIARILEIPVTWVYEYSDTVDEEVNEDFAPFNTINS